ncbi:hypothetical protein PT974_00664 [Cladobotryum mycophilum]|uniref:FYVE-type domain-containing protein n=1 Tax=Cladobotryum mycophilum TaxID=491253 RepID=A0ABR0T1K0_9HYPO
MSSPAQTAGPAPKVEKERKGFGRVFFKVRNALGKGDGASSRRKSTLPPASDPVVVPVPSAPVVPATTPAAAGNDVGVTVRTPPVVCARTAEARARYEAMHGVTKLSRSELFEERAKKLSERFGLEIHPSGWQITVPDDTVLRIDKPIRMRIRRTCHRCNAIFTSSKECSNCQHLRCVKCTRYPPKRTETELVASREKRAAIIKSHKENAPITVDWDWQQTNVVLKRPSKTGGQDLVHKKPRQRVRRTCHECNTLFMAGSKTCEKCSHVRCTDCPRDPPKRDKYPLGYPGDEFGPSSIPHFECDRCHSLYPTGADHGTECKKCKNPKTDKSPRALPRKIEPELDPDLLKQIQAKLDHLKVT